MCIVEGGIKWKLYVRYIHGKKDKDGFGSKSCEIT